MYSEQFSEDVCLFLAMALQVHLLLLNDSLWKSTALSYNTDLSI